MVGIDLTEIINLEINIKPNHLRYLEGHTFPLTRIAGRIKKTQQRRGELELSLMLHLSIRRILGWLLDQQRRDGITAASSHIAA